jgi:hypothetical protein
MQMAMFMKVNGKMTRLMDMVDTCILMELNMKDTGKKINNMEKEKKHGLTMLVIKEIM